MANYAVVRTDNMYGVDVRAGLVSVKYMGADGNTPAAIENGSIVKVDALMTGEREIFTGKDVAAGDAVQDIVLIASPEVMYDERKRNLDEFINEKNTACRGYRLHNGDIFSVTKEAFVDGATPAVGNVVEMAAGTKMKIAETATAGSTTIGTVIAVETAGRYTYYVVRVGEKAAQ